VKPGLFQILIIAMIILVLFGRGRISEMMGDFGKGIKGFRRGLADDDGTPGRIEGPDAVPATDAAAEPRPSAD
jgi:sec-independent protein translocase protein TatA